MAQPAFIKRKNMPERIEWIDRAKAILIFLVVLGHFHYAYVPLAGGVKDLIYAFHVPAFLLITGFLLPADFGASAARLWKKWVGPYVRVYAFFSLIAIAIWWAAESRAQQGLASPLPPIIGAARGISGTENLLVHHNQPLWYFPFLVTSIVTAWAMRNLLGRWALAGAAAYAAFTFLWFGYLDGPRIPWAAGIAGVGCLLIVVGQTARQSYHRFAPVLENRRACALILALSAAALVLASGLNGPTNLNGAMFGNSGLLYLAGAVAGTLMIVALSALLPPSPLWAFLSANTLTIFALHIYLVRMSGRLPKFDAMWKNQLLLLLAALAVTLICAGLSRLLQPVIARVMQGRLFPAREPA